VKRARGGGWVLERATGEGGSRGRRRKRLEGRDTLAPNQRWTGGSLRSAHSNTTRSSSVVDRLTQRATGQRSLLRACPVPRPFSPPPFHHRSRPSRDDGKPAPRDLFEPFSNDVRRHCCAADVDRSAPRRPHPSVGSITGSSDCHVAMDGPALPQARTDAAVRRRMPTWIVVCRRTLNWAECRHGSWLADARPRYVGIEIGHGETRAFDLRAGCEIKHSAPTRI